MEGKRTTRAKNISKQRGACEDEEQEKYRALAESMNLRGYLGAPNYPCVQHRHLQRGRPSDFFAEGPSALSRPAMPAPPRLHDFTRT